MPIQEVGIHVFQVRGGEEASLLAYEQLVELLEAHEDLFASVYRAFNQTRKTWSLVLMGEQAALVPYAELIARVLVEAQAEPIEVPVESLTPFVKRYLVRRAQMQRNRQTFVEQHRPLGRKDYGKQRARGAKGKKKRR